MSGWIIIGGGLLVALGLVLVAWAAWDEMDQRAHPRPRHRLVTVKLPLAVEQAPTPPLARVEPLPRPEDMPWRAHDDRPSCVYPYPWPFQMYQEDEPTWI